MHSLIILAHCDFGIRKSQFPLRYLVRSWFEAGSKLVADRFEAGSATSFEPVCDQDSVMEFGFEPVCDQLRAGSSYLDMLR